MERVAGDVEGLHFGIADLDALLVGTLVEHARNLEAGLGRGGSDQLHDGEPVCQRPTAPVLRDVAEQAMLYSVPLGRARRIVVDVERQLRRIGKPLQLDLPQPHARAVGAAAVGRDGQLLRSWIALAPHALQPAADRRHGELGGVGRDAEADEAGVGSDVVDAIGHHLAQRLVLEVVHVDADRLALGAVVGAAVPEVADQLLLLRIHGDDGLPCSLCRDYLGVDVRELRIAVRMPGAFIGLAVVLPREAELRQFLGNRIGTDRMAHRRQSVRELVHALRDPPQWSFWVTQRGRLHEALQRWNQAAGTRPASRSLTALRPPPARRACRPSGSGPASISSSPRLIVERASPVICDTTARPPQPAVRTSAAANRRRPRSSRWRPTVPQRYLMASSSIMRPTYACSRQSGILASRARPTQPTERDSAIVRSVLSRSLECPTIPGRVCA